MMDSNDQDLPATQPNQLSVRVTKGSLTELGEQRLMLKGFIKNQLKQEIDFGVIPGTKSPSLFKPGAEKIANIFQLGSRIVDRDKTLDLKNNFAMFSVTIEVFHLPTGKAVAQCEGIANSQEVKYKERSKYEGQGGNRRFVGKEETPVADVLNTLSKMAQKRAYVGAILIATGASDFFTQDLEDDAGFSAETAKAAPATPAVPTTAGKGANSGGYVVGFGTKYKGKTLDQMGVEETRSFRDYLVKGAAEQKRPLGGAVKEFVDVANEWLAVAGG